MEGHQPPPQEWPPPARASVTLDSILADKFRTTFAQELALIRRDVDFTKCLRLTGTTPPCPSKNLQLPRIDALQLQDGAGYTCTAAALILTAPVYPMLFSQWCPSDLYRDHNPCHLQIIALEKVPLTQSIYLTLMQHNPYPVNEGVRHCTSMRR